MTNRADVTAATGMKVYFCDAYSPWQRGSNENGLLRQYFPKKTDLTLTSPQRLQQIVDQLNQRPREALGCKTPHEVFWSAAVAMTA